MANSNSRKHARKVTLDAAVNNAIEKAVDTRKVAAFTVGAAGVLAGAAFAFGATPAMAAEAGAADTNPAPVTAGEKADKKASADEKGKDVETGKSQTDANKEAGEQSDKKAESDEKEDANKPEENKQTEEKSGAKQDDQSVVKTDDKKSDEEKQKQETTTATDTTTAGQDREASTTPEPKPQANSTIELSKDKKDTLPNMYAWGKSDNVYIESGQNQSVTFKFAKPDGGYKISKVAIFPNDNIDISNKNAKGFSEYNSGDGEWHQSYSGEYSLQTNGDGSATLTMSKLYRKGTINSAQGYAANRSIYVYGTDKDGKEVLLYKTNIARAATIIPPKKTGSIVLKYDEQLTDEQIRTRLKQALDAPTEAKDGKSVREQIKDASQAHGVGVRKEESKPVVNTTDDPEKKIVITDKQAYDVNQFNSINKVTSQQGQPTTYVTGVNNLKTYLVSDLGYKSEALALTVARYDTRIDKPIVTDPNSISDDVKKEIAKKLANLNHIPQDKVTVNADGTVTINFEGVDPSLAPTIALKDLVLKQLKEEDVKVPTGDKATFVYNPLAYSDAEIKSIKKAIYEANKDNKKLGLSETDYENQISLSYLTGNLTASGHANQGISNGRQENAITVKIKTDKAVAEFKSDITKSKLTKFVNIREDYDVTWNNNRIAGRDSDEGLSWSEDHKTIIYRYDPTKAVAFKSGDVTKLLTATPKTGKEGLRTLTGGENLDHEGAPGQEKKSHVGYILQNGQPTGELTLGIMKSGYWTGDPQITGTDVNMGDVLAKTGEYKWDDDAKPVTLASKDGKIYRARLFVAPYGMESYQYVYTHPDGKNPNNTTKAINVIFVPQTNHKTKDLSKSIGEHKTIKVDNTDVPTESTYYNASDAKKNAYDKALDAATKLYAQVKDTDESKLNEEQKAQIDNATINLNKARAELDGDATKKEELKKSIDENGTAAQGSSAATGTQATNQFKNVSDPDFKDADGKPDTKKNEDAKKAKEAYDKALEEANKLNDDDNATQKAVDAAKANLDAARKKLNDFTTNKDELNAAIAVDGKVNTGDADKTGDDKLKTADPTYQNSKKEERDAYDKAVAQADKVSKDANASQKEVNKAIEDLKKAKAALDANATDKSPLDAAVQKTLDNDSTKHSVFYTNAKNKTNDPAAQQAVKNYDDALAKAKQVLANDKATKKDVEDAKKALEDAEKVLYAETYQTNPTDLGKALADNFSGYLMPAYFNAFDLSQSKDPADTEKAKQAAKDFKAYNDAYHAAKDLMDKAKQQGSTVKQTDVDAVKDNLIKARKAIDKYATDTSKISAALLQSLAIHNSPAYKNASATDASEEAKQAAKAYNDALTELQKAFNDEMDKDVDGKGNEIPESVIPKKGGDTNSANYLDGIQAHAKKQPLNRDVTKLLAKLKEAVAGLDKFATKTDELIKSINEDATTHPSPAFKNAAAPSYKNDDGSDNTDKNTAAKAAADAYGQALAEAKAKLNDPTATQKDINDAKTALDNARKALNAYNTDTTKLKESVKKHGTKEAVPAPEEGTLTSDAYRNASDPHFLTPDGKPDEQKNKQAAADKKAYDAALLKAQELLKKHDDKDTPQDAQPTQQEIDSALKDLDDARTKLGTYKTDTTALNTEAEKSQADTAGASAAGKFEDSPEFKNADAEQGEDAKADVKAYKEALKKARDLVKAATEQGKKNSERPTQQQINEALDALKAAKKQITDNYKTNVTALKGVKEFAAGDFKKTPEYNNAAALKDDQNAEQEKKNAAKADVDALDENTNDSALKKAKEILDKFDENGNPNTGGRIPTQAQVDAALKTLQDAMNKVTENYKTDVKLLSNEVGDKDEQGKPVTPPFEASVAYKNALEKANAGDNDATAKLKTYADKLKEANDLIEKVKNPDQNADPDKKPTQKQVDDALDALKKAKKDIDDTFKTKVDDLQKEVDDKDADGNVHNPTFESTTEFANLKAKTVEGKKPDDLVAYEQALAKAKELIDKNDGEVADPTDPTKKVAVPKDQLPSQKEVDEAKKALKEIKDKILANYKTSPVDLQNEVDKSKDGNDDKRDGLFENTPAFKNVTNNSSDAAKQALKDYNDKLNAAKEMLEKFDRTTGKPKKGAQDVPTQAKLDEALKALQDAKKKIEDDYSTSKSDLRQEAGDNFTNSPEYQNAQAKGDDASKQALDEYQKALDEANSVLADPNATQAEVDAALKRLQAAKDKLKAENSTDKSKLQAEADDDANFRKSPYFIIGNKADIEAYENALAEAKSVLADPNATQAEVDAALKKLEEAKKRILDFLSHFGGSGNGTGDWNGYGFVNGHESYGALVDKTALQIEVNNAVETSANTAEAVVYRQALAEARSVLNDPNATQAQVDAALRKLAEAKAALLNSLSGASGHKIAKTGAATGLFAGFAAIFAGLGAAGVASRRRKHSNE